MGAGFDGREDFQVVAVGTQHRRLDGGGVGGDIGLPSRYRLGPRQRVRKNPELDGVEVRLGLIPVVRVADELESGIA